MSFAQHHLKSIFLRLMLSNTSLKDSFRFFRANIKSYFRRCSRIFKCILCFQFKAFNEHIADVRSFTKDTFDLYEVAHWEFHNIIGTSYTDVERLDIDIRVINFRNVSTYFHAITQHRTFFKISEVEEISDNLLKSWASGFLGVRMSLLIIPSRFSNGNAE